MKEIQDKRLENELKSLMTEKTTEIKINISKDNRNEYYIDITIPKLLSLEQMDINALLIVKQNYPFAPPKLYFKTKHVFPHLSDGRDMAEDVLSCTWSPIFKLLDLIEKIPKFIIEYTNSLKQRCILLSGSYYLGEHFNISFLENLPVFSKRVRERVMIKGKPTDIAKLLLISDLYFCLYEIDKKSKGNAILTFWSHIKGLINIKILVNDNLCKFVWRNQLENQKLFELIITTPNGEEIQTVLLQNNSKLGINYNVNRRSSEAQTGSLPPTDIYIIEIQIEELEKEIRFKPTIEKVKLLMTLYENSVEFYSAIGNPRYEYFTQRIQKLLNTPEMTELITNDLNSQSVIKTDANEASTKETQKSELNSNNNNQSEVERIEEVNKEDDSPIKTDDDKSLTDNNNIQQNKAQK